MSDATHTTEETIGPLDKEIVEFLDKYISKVAPDAAAALDYLDKVVGIAVSMAVSIVQIAECGGPEAMSAIGFGFVQIVSENVRSAIEEYVDGGDDEADDDGVDFNPEEPSGNH